MSFDPNLVQFGNLPKTSNVPTRRPLFPSGQPQVNNTADENSSNRSSSTGTDSPLDLTTFRAKLPSTTNNNSVHVSNAVSTNTVANTALSSGEVQAYESRIDGLIKANQAKINRIRELQAVEVERNNLLGQVELLHRLNFNLTQTVDALRVPDGNSPSKEIDEYKQTIKKLELDVRIYRSRVSNLNATILQLEGENKRLTDILATHSKKVLSEHNYNM